MKSINIKNLFLFLFILFGILFLVFTGLNLLSDNYQKIPPNNSSSVGQIANPIIENQNSNLNNSKPMLKIRKPAVAGSFYPSNFEELKSQVDRFLAKAPTNLPSARMILVPHAGYDYSGQVAAYGFRALQNYAKSNNLQEPTVILLGMSHQTYLTGFAVDPNDQWETSLGNVSLDKEMIESLSHKATFSLSEEAFLEEHSLEVEIPFLKETLGDFKIVPILVGDLKNADLEKFASSLESVMNDNSLVVISSDLSHYPAYQDAQKIDKETIKGILSQDVATFDKALADLESKKVGNALTFACGEKAIKLGIYLGNKLGLKNSKLLFSAN